MKKLLACIFGYLAVAEGGLLMFDIPDTHPLRRTPIDPNYTGCNLTETTNDVDDFMKLIRQRRFYGPCRYEMESYQMGALKSYIADHNPPRSEYIKFVMSISAPREVTTYITTFRVEQVRPGSSCSNVRLSFDEVEGRWRRRYFKTVEAVDDTEPIWHTVNSFPIKGGWYLFELPTSCLTEFTNFSVKLKYVYEDVAVQARLLENNMKLKQMPGGDCGFEKKSKRVPTLLDYDDMVESLPKDCSFRFRRSYDWVVPASHVSFKDGWTEVIAQIGVNEGLREDLVRRIGRIKLSKVVGKSCSQALLYARPKYGRAGQDIKIDTLVHKGNSLTAKLEQPYYNLFMDFIFKLPNGCRMVNPLFEIAVDDISHPAE